MASSRIEMDDYENATKLEEDQEIYKKIETAHEDIKKDPMLKIETCHGSIKNDSVLILSLKKWLQFVLLPLLIVSAELEEKLEKKYAFLMTKQNISATDIHARGNEARTELALKMEKKYAFLIANQNISATKIHALVNDARVAVTACVTSTQRFSDYIVRFSSINFQVGIDNLDTLKSSGKFVCEIPGLYYISAHIVTSNQNNGFYVKQNYKTIAKCRSDAGDTPSANPISAVVELQLKDTLYVYASHTDIIRSSSCLSIVKVKLNVALKQFMRIYILFH
ncbi:Hypothetical predicted protein [Mytilus galloprovincialis]|uniref:C1q domain-containing protein n=1 Tax=Mytilus galloprovincialis TaxID=29158 RepID=A0A8B6D4N5_MYTGA|nr:Hypothetical predicted protein [Mytilus galloprovincialis]